MHRPASTNWLPPNWVLIDAQVEVDPRTFEHCFKDTKQKKRGRPSKAELEANKSHRERALEKRKNREAQQGFLNSFRKKVNPEDID